MGVTSGPSGGYVPLGQLTGAAAGTPAAGSTVLGLIGGAIRQFAARLLYDTWLGGLSNEAGQSLGSHLASLAAPVTSWGCKCDGVDIDETAAGLAIATTVGTALTVTGDDIFRSGIESASVPSDKTGYIVGNDGLVYSRTITARSDDKNVTISSPLPSDVSGAVFRLGAAPQGATVLAGSLSTLRLPPNYTPFVSTDPGKLIQFDCAAATGGVHRTTIATYVDPSTVTLTDPAPGAVSYAPWGYGTDDAVGLQRAFSSGKSLFLAGVIFCSAAINTTSNVTVHCDARIRLHHSASIAGAGGWLLLKNGTRNFKWIGGIVDAAGVVNCNIFAIGDVPNSSRFTQDIWLTGFRLKRARIDTALEASSVALFGGGGKGFTVQFRARNVIISDFTIDDCDVGFSCEAANSESRYVENINIHSGTVRKSQRAAMYIQGGIPPGLASTAAAEYISTEYPGVKISNMILDDNCLAQTVAVPGVGTANSYDTHGVISLNYALCLRMRGIDIRQKTGTATLIRGQMLHSVVELTAVGDSLKDLWDSNPIPTLDAAAGLTLPKVLLTAVVNAKAVISGGVCVRGYSNAIINGNINIREYGYAPGGLTVTGSIGGGTWYVFEDATGSVFRRLRGNGSVATTPNFGVTAGTGISTVQGIELDYLIKERRGTASPAGVVTPICIGDKFRDTTNKVLYEAYGTTTSDWKAVTMV